MTRVLGKAWTLAAIRHALRTGDAQYYFHPYELGSRPAVAFGTKERLFMRRVGPWMEDALDRILHKLRSWGMEGPDDGRFGGLPDAVRTACSAGTSQRTRRPSHTEASILRKP